MTFTEPGLGVSLASSDASEVTIRVHLSREAVPAALAESHDIYEYFVPLTLSLSDLSAAADRWAQDLEVYPER